ncbi:MAG: hypothetical protein JOZ43_02245 [Acidobacteriales bacterium]|nr:hypothetical protein [Terriglobales bacterium]
MAKGNKPDYNIRAKVGEIWQSVGVAWHAKDGAISVRLNLLPIGEWDGSLLMLPPKEENGG